MGRRLACLHALDDGGVKPLIGFAGLVGKRRRVQIVWEGFTRYNNWLIANQQE
jgi:hypothetical protein